MLFFEPLFIEEVADWSHFDDVFEGLCLSFDISAFKTDQSVGHGVVLLFGNVLAYYLYKVGQWHDGAADDEVVFAFLFFAGEL